MKPYLTLTPCILWGNDMDGKSRHEGDEIEQRSLHAFHFGIRYLGFRSFTEIFRNDTKFHFTYFTVAQNGMESNSAKK
jgi:hypothetical protein